MTTPRLVYSQHNGAVSLDGAVLAHGYSGLDAGKNNPSAECQQGVGPIPVGEYDLTGIENSAQTGPFTIILVPSQGTNTFGRSAFRIHGDSVTHPGEASHGCIILPRVVRHEIWDSGVRSLSVVA